MSKNLIIYYSREGENFWNGTVKKLDKGNTEIVVEYIQNAIGADLFKVETVKSYPADYFQCAELAKQEQIDQVRPELKNYLTSLDGYDNVFVCGPCWWGTFPMAVFTQLERLNWEGKKVMAVMTHEGSSLGGCEDDLQRICVGATFGRGLAVHGAEAARAERGVEAWAKSVV